MSDDETPTTANEETVSSGSATAAGSAKKTTKRTAAARSGVSAAERAKAAQIRAAARGSAARTSETKRTAASTAAARTAAARAAAEKAEAAKAEAKAREAESAAAKVAAVKASSPAPAPTGRRSSTAKKKADAAPVSEAVADAGSAATAEKPAAAGKPATTKKPATAKKTTKTTAAKKSTTVRKTATPRTSAAAPVPAETAPDAASAPDQPAAVRKTSSASKGTTRSTTPAKKTAPARKAPAKAGPARKSPASRAAAAADLAEVGAPARPTESAVAEDGAGVTHAASQDPSSAPSGSDAENAAAPAEEAVVPEAEGQAAEPAAPEEPAHPGTDGAVAQDASSATDEVPAATVADRAPDDGAETGGDDAPAAVVSSLPDPDDGSEHALVIRDLVKSFGDSRAVDGISLTVPSGSFYGIVGPNGAGKTTTLSIVAGLLSGDSGTVRVCGVDRAEDPRGAKKLMGVLPDRLRTFDRLTGRQLLHYYGLLRGLSADVVEARTVDLARAFDLTGALSRVVSDYSAGMTKKIMLAGAMIHSPRVLVLDEPFESVDPVSSGVILDILRAYVAHGGTVILSSHGMDLVEQVCSRIAIIVGGEVLAEGTVDEVRAGQTLEQRFVELSGGIAEVEGLEWLHTFSD